MKELRTAIITLMVTDLLNHRVLRTRLIKNFQFNRFNSFQDIKFWKNKIESKKKLKNPQKLSHELQYFLKLKNTHSRNILKIDSSLSNQLKFFLLFLKHYDPNNHNSKITLNFESKYSYPQELSILLPNPDRFCYIAVTVGIMEKDVKKLLINTILKTVQMNKNAITVWNNCFVSYITYCILRKKPLMIEKLDDLISNKNINQFIMKYTNQDIYGEQKRIFSTIFQKYKERNFVQGKYISKYKNIISDKMLEYSEYMIDKIVSNDKTIITSIVSFDILNQYLKYQNIINTKSDKFFHENNIGIDYVSGPIACFWISLAKHN